MKELGNLAIICARRSDVLLQVQDGIVTVHVGAGHERAALHSAWDNDMEIRRVIHELNFDKYALRQDNAHILASA